MNDGQLIVITGPSGVGKGTLVRSLLDRHRDLYLSVSATTRAPRAGETDGEDYYFTTREHFQAAIAAGELLEWAEFAGNLYGTPRRPVEERIAQGDRVLLEIELEGARQIQQTFPSALRLFLLPPSLDELERRLRKRDRDSPDAIARRLQRARQEIEAAGEFDRAIVNDDLDLALAEVEEMLFSSAVS